MATSDSTTSTPLLSTSSLPVTHISIPVSTKLDRTNFFTWRSQIEPIVDGYGLTKHLDSSFAPPSRQITEDDTSSPNTEFRLWHMQDSVASWMASLHYFWLCFVSICSLPDFSFFVECFTSRLLGCLICENYGASSSSSVTRGGQGYNDYFERMHSIADQLAAVGEPVSDSDLVRCILNGLRSEFNSFVVALTTRSNPVSLDDLHGFLFSQERLS
jgi:gag-polypeptide of LTR copia-type